MGVLRPGVAIVLPRLAAVESFSGGGGSKGQSLRGWEVFVRRVRQTAAQGLLLLAAEVAGLRWRVLRGRMGRWEWWSGVIEAAMLVIRSRRCFGGRVYSWQPATSRTGWPSCLPCAGSAALRPTKVRPITRGLITSYHSIHEELHYTTLLPTSF